jgi:hypothetical protein
MNEKTRVTVQGPADVYDYVDASTGTRFVQGYARDVPLSVARELAKRKGYEITSVFYTRKEQHNA